MSVFNSCKNIEVDSNSDSQSGSYLGPSFENEKIKEFLDSSSIKYMELHDMKIPPKVFIIGNNSSTVAFKENILEPCLNFIGEKEYNRWQDLKKANNIESIKQYENEKQAILTILNGFVTYYGYIRIFNKLFKSLVQEDTTDLKVLSNIIRTKKVLPDENVLESFRNGIFIVDEFQKLYNNINIILKIFIYKKWSDIFILINQSLL
jgi:hypothetical protein